MEPCEGLDCAAPLTCIGSAELGWFCSHECETLATCEAPASGCAADLGEPWESWCAIGCFAVECPAGWNCEVLDETSVCFPA